MKRWQVIAAIAFPLLLTAALVRYAQAADFTELPPLGAAVLSKAAVLFDGLLNYWVAGNDLTTPAGEQLVSAFAHTVVTTVDFLAEIVTWF